MSRGSTSDSPLSRPNLLRSRLMSSRRQCHGVVHPAPELVGKCLEQLKQAVPGVSRVAVLWHPGGLGERTEKNMLKEAEIAARALGVRLQVVEARAPTDFARAFSEMTRARAGALTVVASNM